MKKTIKLLGLLIILLVSFIYTNNVFSIARKNDKLMKEVLNYKNNHEIKAVEPLFNLDEVIIGYSGVKVNTELSYKNMKAENKFNKDKIIYDKVMPNDKLSKLKNYYIKQGNKKNNSVSLIFKVKNDANLSDLLEVLDKYKVSTTFFIDGYYIENNLSTLFNINKKNHEIYNLGYMEKYDKKNISKTNKLIESITLNDSIYCLNERKDDKQKEICKNKKMYSIYPTLINPNFLELKKNLESGIIISYNLDDFNISNFKYIYDIIYSRGLKIDYLKNVLNEI